MIANLAGGELLKIKPGSACRPVYGYDIQVLNVDGKVAAANEEGSVVIKLPLPPGCLPTLWQDNQRFIRSLSQPISRILFFRRRWIQRRRRIHFYYRPN